MDEEQVRNQKIRERGFWDGAKVKARVRIHDSPLAEDDASARQGESGVIVDIADGWLFVDFGRGVIICHPDEVS
jgi:hypothetical protein